MKKIKICFICSSGGHFSELKKLNTLAVKYNGFLLTEKTDNFKSDFCEKQYFVSIINRREKVFIFHFLWLFIKEFFIFIKEKPSVVISTGALCAYPMMKIGRFFHKKTVYIESIARIKELSLTGKKLYNKVDLFLVQWIDLLDKYPNAIYVGNLFGEGD